MEWYLQTEQKYWKVKKKNLFGFIGSHAPKEEFFEFRIEKSEVTNHTILVIKDFADKKEIKDQSQLWESPGQGTLSPLRKLISENIYQQEKIVP